MTPPDNDKSLHAAYAVCQGITKREARNFYYAFVTLPPPKRRAIYAVYAFSRIADDIADGAGTPREKRDQLSDLRNRLHKALTGDPEGPVLIALGDAAKRYVIPESLLQDLISGMEMDITNQRFVTFNDLRRYCYHVASVVGLISIQVFGHVDDPRVHGYAVDFGLAMQLTNILRDLREDIERDRVYLPQDELERFGYTETDLRAGVMNANFRLLMQFQATRAHSFFDSAERLLPLLETRSQGCATGLLRLYNRLLKRIEARDFDVFSCRVSLSSWEKLRLTCRLWAASRISLPFTR